MPAQSRLRGSLSRPGAKLSLDPVNLDPPWHAWKVGPQLSVRVRKWIEQYCIIPTGHNAGYPMKLADYQRLIVKRTYDNNLRVLIVSIPSANAKTTTLAAMALERMTRGDSFSHVAIMATKQEQAQFMVDVAKQMVELSPDLKPLFDWYASDATLLYKPTGSTMKAYPARLQYTQGLNFNLCIIDECGFVPDVLVQALIARVSKRPDSIVVGIGTPGFEPNIMFRLREQHNSNTLPSGVEYLEWSAPYGCDIHDPVAHTQANPALGPGIMNRDTLPLQASIMPERDFRIYHLGQWVDAAVTRWLPEGAWENCPHADAPPDKAEIVIAIDGTYKRTTAVVGATVTEGAVFLLWAAEEATDLELTRVLDLAHERWSVRKLVPFARIRSELFARYAKRGVPVEPWAERHAESVTATNELYRAIIEQRIPHDHHPLMTEHMGNIASRPTSDGIVLQRVAPEGRWIDAAMAARTAWWKASQVEPIGDLRIF